MQRAGGAGRRNAASQPHIPFSTLREATGYQEKLHALVMSLAFVTCPPFIFLFFQLPASLTSQSPQTHFTLKFSHVTGAIGVSLMALSKPSDVFLFVAQNPGVLPS